MKQTIWLLFSLTLTLVLVAGCVAAIQNYEKVSLGMTKEEVKKIAGDPHRIYEGETTGEGPLFTKPGKHEIWIYKGGVLVFVGDKLVSKGHKAQP